MHREECARKMQVRNAQRDKARVKECVEKKAQMRMRRVRMRREKDAQIKNAQMRKD